MKFKKIFTFLLFVMISSAGFSQSSGGNTGDSQQGNNNNNNNSCQQQKRDCRAAVAPVDRAACRASATFLLLFSQTIFRACLQAENDRVRNERNACNSICN